VNDLPPTLPATPIDPHVALAVRQDYIYRAVLSLKEAIIMPLSDRLQAGFDHIAAQLADLDTDVDAALQAATTLNVSLRDQVTALEAVRDGLTAQVGTDAAEITRLNDVIAALQSAQASAEHDLVGRLDALSSSVDAIDQGVPGGSATQPGLLGATP
jgi:hypothetical protein